MRIIAQVFLAVMIGGAVAVAQSDVEKFASAFAEVRQVEVEHPFEVAILALREKYLGAVDRELKKAIDAGDLDAAAALKHEKEAFDFAGEPPHPNPTVAPLIRLRQAHAAESKKLEAQRATNLAASVARFAVRIKEKEVELTKAQKIEEALALRSYRTKLEQSVSAGAAVAVQGATPSTPEGVWHPVFNGKDLTGWKPRDSVKNFRVSGGALEVDRVSAAVDYLFFEGTKEVPVVLRNFELRAKIKADPAANSGFYFHTGKESVRAGGHPASGHEISLQSGPGKIEFPTGSLYKVTPMVEPKVDQADWFDLRFRVQGQRITVWINEEQFLDYTEPTNSARAPDSKGLSPTGGNLAIQANSPGAVYYFKSIEVKVLPD